LPIAWAARCIDDLVHGGRDLQLNCFRAGLDKALGGWGAQPSASFGKVDHDRFAMTPSQVLVHSNSPRASTGFGSIPCRRCACGTLKSGRLCPLLLARTATSSRAKRVESKGSEVLKPFLRHAPVVIHNRLCRERRLWWAFGNGHGVPRGRARVCLIRPG
jgi:hypothetical protein